jgi:hypothetical protein
VVTSRVRYARPPAPPTAPQKHFKRTLPSLRTQLVITQSRGPPPTFFSPLRLREGEGDAKKVSCSSCGGNVERAVQRCGAAFSATETPSDAAPRIPRPKPPAIARLWRVSDHKPSPLREAPGAANSATKHFKIHLNPTLFLPICFQLRCYEHTTIATTTGGTQKKVSGSSCGGNVERAVKARGGRLACIRSRGIASMKLALPFSRHRC